MILTCEYCGAEIDTDKEDVCPFKGGTFQHNKDYLENKARQVESEQLDMEQKKPGYRKTETGRYRRTGYRVKNRDYTE